MVEIFGTAEPRFESVRKTLERLIDEGGDVGGSVAVAVDGEIVADIWGGYHDDSRTDPWNRDTITNVWSMTKTVSALCALILVDRGQIDLDAPVATYWPEFAQNGKSGVLIKHLLSHTSGVSGWEQPIDISDIYDWETSTARLAQQAPWWEPGTASGYHAVNYGHLIGEVVRRVTGQKLGEFLATEVAGPLGADFHIGLSDKEIARISPNINFPPGPPADMSQVDMDSVMMKTATGPAPQVESSWTTDWQRADIGGANGHTNARGIVRLQSLVTNKGEVDGIRLLSPGTIDRIFEEQSNGPDLVIGSQLRWGIGYCLEYGEMPYIPNGRVAFWGGRGGSMVVNDVDRGLTIGFVQNKLAADSVGTPSSEAIVRSVYNAL